MVQNKSLPAQGGCFLFLFFFHCSAQSKASFSQALLKRQLQPITKLPFKLNIDFNFQSFISAHSVLLLVLGRTSSRF